MTTATMNGNVRKNLSEQIDRLDTILDGLSDGLSGAVADAVRESVATVVKEVVQNVLIEVLTNPAVLERLRGTPAAPTASAAKPGRVAQVVSQVNAWAAAGWAKVRQVIATGRQRLMQAPAVALAHGRVIWAFRRPLLVAVGAGVASGVAAYHAGPWFAATAASLAGFTAVAAAQLSATLRRVMEMYTTRSDG
jgi:hypothetical protein